MTAAPHTERCIIAGFGGQGILLMGQLLAEAGMNENRQVSWLPSYGPEMRGGTANCTVIVSEREIPSPIVSHDASSVVIMNLPSLARFIPELESGGVALINSSLVTERPDRPDIRAVYVPANEIASELGNMKVSNLVMLGAYLEVTHAVQPESLLAALERRIGGKNAGLMDLNREGGRGGAAPARAQLTA